MLPLSAEFLFVLGAGMVLSKIISNVIMGTQLVVEIVRLKLATIAIKVLLLSARLLTNVEMA